MLLLPWSLQKVPVKTWEVQPALLTKDYLVQRLGPEVTPATAEKALARLLGEVIDEKGTVKKNPRKVDWVALAAQEPGEFMGHVVTRARVVLEDGW
jgi:hypothetical protein